MRASDRHDRPSSYLQDGQRWISYGHGMFRRGTLRSDAPAEAYLVQVISLRLHQEYRKPYDDGPDGKDWSFRKRLSFRKIADRCGITERALHDLWHGNSWPKLRTIARIEMIMNDLLWNSQHLDAYRKKLNKQPSQPAAVQQDMDLP